ncbi:putative acyl-CoA dehydrogenase [compost metagenome]
MVHIYLNEAMDQVWLHGKEALNSFAEGDELRMMMMGLKRFTKTEPFNVKDARQRVAKVVIEKNKYPF